MFQTIQELALASHRLPALRIRSVARPVAKALVFAVVAGAIAALVLASLF